MATESARMSHLSTMSLTANPGHHVSGHEPQDRIAIELPNSTVVVEPDRTAWVLRSDGWDRTAPQPPENVAALRVMSR